MHSAPERSAQEKISYRVLTTSEIGNLTTNGNSAENWQNIMVQDEFNPDKIRNCVFIGQINIGQLNKTEIVHGSLCLPVGLYNSMIRSCHIGNDIAIHNVRYLNNYVIEDTTLLFNIDELSADDDAVFGMGYEQKSKRNWLKICNENGGRKILPFPGMRPADAQLWSQYGTDADISRKLVQFTGYIDQHKKKSKAVIGQNSVIKNSRTILNAAFGSFCFVSGVESLKNITVQSSKDEPAVIEDGVVLTNSVIGYANHIKRGVNADHVFTCRNVKLEHGLRIFHTFVSPNSTIACGEVANNMLLPFHEQHHNNSFLIASTLLGQSNIAAGATIGSNHNSRAADGEIIAERGFWPGLCSNFKHNSYFSHFSLIAKGNYDSELNIKLPFSLISINPANNAVQIMPGYWFKYNMYALERNSWKFKKRDQRKLKNQYIETEYLAPDTVQSMLAGIDILLDAINQHATKTWTIDILDPNMDKEIDLRLDGMVNKNQIKVIKPIQGILLYREMIEYYAALQIVKSLELANADSPKAALNQIIEKTLELEKYKWINLGGQPITEDHLYSLLNDMKDGSIKSWTDVHNRYDSLLEKYEEQKTEYAFSCLRQITKGKEISPELIIRTLQNAVNTAKKLLKNAIASRQKDFSDPFRGLVYKNDEEMSAVLTTIDEDQFIKEYKLEIYDWCTNANSLIDKLAIK